MAQLTRVLDRAPIGSLEDYVEIGGGRAIAAARAIDRGTVLEEIVASGLRGRGGAGFPTGRKWRTVAENDAGAAPATVVVNGAEGEPGCFKDRAILRANPYRVLEGALVAAHAVGADSIVVALKRTFERERDRVEGARDEVAAAGWLDGIEVDVFEGPSEYLFGEETGLLEAVAGRAPLPRIAPPYRRGLDDVVERAADLDDPTASPAHIELAGPSSATIGTPTLVDNVETLANVPGIISGGAAWFRSAGTAQSPGTIVCTVSGATRRHGVGEFTLGTPLSEVLDVVGGGPRAGHRVRAVMCGVSNALLGSGDLDVPLSYESMAARRTGLGTAGFIVYDDASDLLAVAAGVARFLAVESCGQCTPCKQDGLALADTLARICASSQSATDVHAVGDRLATVADSARCNLAGQQQSVVGSIIERFADDLDGHSDGRLDAVEPVVIAPIVDLVDGQAVLDPTQRHKQPDWTFDQTDSGQAPADRLAEHGLAAETDERMP